MSHVNETHPFQAQKGVVFFTVQFPIDNRPYGASLTNEVGPHANGGEDQTLLTQTGAEGRSRPDTLGMVDNSARLGLTSIGESESPVAEHAFEDGLVRSRD